jgi:sugar-specific transcriptional regulator TrmB
MDVSREVQTLIDLGLTSLQARIYLALYQTGTSEAATISKVTKVARSDVYRTMYKLQQLGLIEKEITNPIRFKAIPIETGFSILLERKAKKYNELKSKTNSLLLTLKKKTNCENSFQGESKFVLIPSREVLIQSLTKAIGNTQTNIDVSTSVRRFKLACYRLAESLEKAWQRGVKGRAIIEETEEPFLEVVEASWKNPSAVIRYTPTIPKTVMAIYDKKEVFIYIEPTADLEESPALWSNNPSLLALAKDCFETLWKTAKKTGKKCS